MSLFQGNAVPDNLSVCYCTGRCENGTKTCSGEELPKDRELRLLRAAVKVVPLHTPTADTYGEIYCTIRGGDYYSYCPLFNNGEEWKDHITNVMNRALEEQR